MGFLGCNVPPNLVLVPGVWRGGKMRGVNYEDSGGLGSGGRGGSAVRVCFALS